MHALGVTEAFRVKEQALISATEAAEMILRVDDIVRCDLVSQNSRQIQLLPAFSRASELVG